MYKKQLILILSLAFSTSIWAQGADTVRVIIGQRTYQSTLPDETFTLNSLKSSVETFEGQLRALNLRKDSLMNLMVRHNDDPDKAKAFSEQIKQNKKNIEQLKDKLAQIDRQLANFEVAPTTEDLAPADSTDRWQFDFDWDEFKFKRKDNRFYGHWAGIEIGFAGLMNAQHRTSLTNDAAFMELNGARSWSFAINVPEFSIPLVNPSFGLVTGMGLEWDYFSLAKDILIDLNNDQVVAVPQTDKGELSSNQFSTFFVNFPLIVELKFPASRRNQFHIGVGAVGSIRIHSAQTISWRENSMTKTLMQRGEMGLNSFRGGLTARIGYGFLHLYANYSLTSFFKKDKGPELYPFTAGIVLLNF